MCSTLVVSQFEAVRQLQLSAAYKTDAVALDIGAQHPGDVFHVVDGRMRAVHVLGAGRNLERDAAVDSGTADDADAAGAGYSAELKTLRELKTSD